MKKLFLFLCIIVQVYSFAQAPTETYPIDSASVEHAGVPKGEVLKFTFDQSKIFPGTWREYWVYVPAQYKPDKPACVYVNQDGIQWKAPTVFDNLIYKNEMPVTIGVFVTWGRVRADSGSNALDRFNRSFEYDGLGDAYSRFILAEILPEVEKKKQVMAVPFIYQKWKRPGYRRIKQRRCLRIHGGMGTPGRIFKSVQRYRNVYWVAWR